MNIDKLPPKGATQVWSPLFQASWDKLSELQGGELKRVVPPNDLITKPQNFEWKAEEVMPKGGYAVYAGPATAGFARETAASIKKRYDVEIEIDRVVIDRKSNPEGKVAYGILLHESKFKKEFFRSKKKALEFRSRTGENHRVAFFGTAGDFSGGFRDDVQVLYHDPEASSSIFRIATDSEDENLIVYRPEKECSFPDAIKRVEKAMGNP